MPPMNVCAPRPLLEVRRLSKIYAKGQGARSALHEVSFVVGKGEFVSVIGPSGAGKSTLLRCINRMVEPSSGEVRFDGELVGALQRRDLKRLRSRIGMVFQHYNLVDRLSAIENVLHGRLGAKSAVAGVLGFYTRAEKLQAMDTLERLGLAEHAYQRCDRLSGGQKQRVGIARALVQRPAMILCDEPIASLDPNASRNIMEQLRGLARELGITLIVNLHQVDVALRHSDRILGINGGRLVFDAVPPRLDAESITAIYGSEADAVPGASRQLHAA